MNEAQMVARGVMDRMASAHVMSLTDFKRRLWPGYQHMPFHTAIDEHLEQVALYLLTGGKRGISHLMINLPPRHGKTETASRYFPALMLGRLPDLRVITTSYTADLAYKNSRRTRAILDTPAYKAMWPATRLSGDRSAVKEWEVLDRAGGMYAAGVGGGITGFGGNLIIVDDPVKNRAQAESKTFRERSKEWYVNDLISREEPPSVIVMPVTRWHEDDLAGWLLSEMVYPWVVLRLPALAEADDPLGRAEGEALWPKRYSAAALLKKRAQMGEYEFASLYQQRPQPAGGGLYHAEQIEIVQHVPECTQIVRFYDLAVTAKARSDYTAGALLGVTADERFVILDMYRGQRELPDTHEAIVQRAGIDGANVSITLEAEKAGIVQLQFLLRDERMRPYRINAVPPIGDKFTRAGPFAARVNAGRVMMVRGAWNRALLDELATFPQGEHDDQVDALSGAYAMLARGPLAGAEYLDDLDW